MFSDKNQHNQIDYTIHSYSSTSQSFRPENILSDESDNANSRWTTTSNDGNQFIILKLKEDALITSVVFGKFQKIHVCNIRHMEIYSLMEIEGASESASSKEEPDCFSLYRQPFYNAEGQSICIFKGGLRNDTSPETFPMKFTSKNSFIISRYIKIRPMQAWGVNFNFSLWHVKVRGITDKLVLDKCIQHNYTYLTSECYKLIFKYLEDQKNVETLKSLQAETGMHYESNIKKEMKSLITEDDFEGVEKKMCGAVVEGLVDKEMYLSGDWSQVMESGPEKRGGHAAAVYKEELYIHGGWCGKEDLGDMWVFNCASEKWSRVVKVNQKRSCHKLILLPGRLNHKLPENNQIKAENTKPEIIPDINNSHDEKAGVTDDKVKLPEKPIIGKSTKRHNKKKKEKPKETKIIHDSYYFDHDTFLLIGRYVQRELKEKRMVILSYDVLNNKLSNFKFCWEAENIYDHQTLLINGVLHVFGGKVSIAENISYGGLYTLNGNTFEKRKYEKNELFILKGRIGHEIIYYENKYFVDPSPVFENGAKFSDNLNKNLIARRNIFIIGGIRDKQTYYNITFYDTDTETIYKTVDFPIETMYKVVQRCVLIEDKIYFLFCYESTKPNLLDKISFYAYDILKDLWTIIKSEKTGPRPRLAHSFSYVPELKRFYLFGGNIGNTTSHKRLDDLWKFEISQIEDDALMQKIKFDVRKHKFLKLLNVNLENALGYLQNEVYDVIDHTDSHDVLKFKKLCLEVYKPQRNISTEEIINDLSKYFIDAMKPLRSNIYDGIE